MPQLLDFSALQCEYVTIKTRDGQEYALRDDVPSTVMFATFALNELQADITLLMARADRLALEHKHDSEEAQAQVMKDIYAELNALTDEMHARYVHLCGDIFRHSYPGMTDEELRTHLNVDDCQAVIGTFSRLRGASSVTPPPATEQAQTSPAQPAQSQVQGQMSRSQRRRQRNRLYR